MRFLYSLLYTFAFLLALPYYVIIGLYRGKYLSTFWQRLGNLSFESNAPSIWIHTVSVGEYLASRSLIQKLESLYEGMPVFVSTTTVTAQKLARQSRPDSTFYFPFDWGWTVRRVFRKIRPRIVIVMETEIWPNILWNAERLGIPAILVNGRLSDRSMSRYIHVKKWLPKFTGSWMQTENDAERMKSLGAKEVFVMGNLKYDIRPGLPSEEFSTLLKNWKGSALVLAAGSTMEGEEEIILDLYKNLRQDFFAKLLIAPRHPERFDEVAELITAGGFDGFRKSRGNVPESDVMLLDTMGELAGAYQFADMVLIGGTLLSGGGGHNPIEPAYFGKAIVSGPNFANFRSVFADFHQKNAILISNDLLGDLRKLCGDAKLRLVLGEAARSMVQENAGATDRIVTALQRFLSNSTLTRESAVIG